MLGSNALRNVTFTQTLPSIEFLSLSSNKLKALPVLSALPGLVQLNMSNNNLKVSKWDFLTKYFLFYSVAWNKNYNRSAKVCGGRHLRGRVNHS